MNSHGSRARLAGVLLVALAAALALVALPGVASAHHHHQGPGDAGTIESFDAESGVLTIALGEGGTIAGLVTPRTHIRCDEGRHRGRQHRRHRLRHGRASASHDRGGRGDAGPPEEGGPRGEGGTDPEGEEPGTGPGDRTAGRPDEGGPQAGEDPPGHDGTAPGRSEGPGRGAEHSARCTRDDLTEGTTVKFAELVLVDGKAIFNLVALPAVQVPAVQGDESEGEGDAGASPGE